MACGDIHFFAADNKSGASMADAEEAKLAMAVTEVLLAALPNARMLSTFGKRPCEWLQVSSYSLLPVA